VVRGRPLEILIIDIKAQGLYQVELGIKSHAGPHYIARILGYLGLEKYNVDHN
jgi:hypothetical protein